jgi:hypothetical protein
VVAGNWLLTAWLGIVGVALIFTLAEVFGLLVLLCLTSKWVNHRISQSGIAASVATVAMLACVGWASEAALWLRAVLATTSFPLVFWLAGGITLGEARSLARQIVSWPSHDLSGSSE